MSVYETFPDEVAFWDEFSGVDKKTGVKSCFAWSKAVQHARRIRQQADKEDAEKAKIEYEGKNSEFNDVFSYRRGGNMFVYKDDHSIARKYREIKGLPRPWDEDP
jgi:hypothetical protein